MTETPEMAYINHRAARVPWITGFTRDEMVWLVSALIQDESAVADLNNNWETVGPVMFGLVYNTTENNIEAARQIRQFYMGNETLHFGTRHQFSRVRTIFNGSGNKTCPRFYVMLFLNFSHLETDLLLNVDWKPCATTHGLQGRQPTGMF